MDMPLPDSEVFASIEKLYSELDKIRTLLTDAEKTSVRLVINPEKMVIKEAQSTFTYLNLYGYVTDLIICNRLIPEVVKDHYFQAWKDSQVKHRQLISECFAPLPISNVPLMEQEVVGIPMLKVMAEALYRGMTLPLSSFRGKFRISRKRASIMSSPLPCPSPVRRKSL